MQVIGVVNGKSAINLARPGPDQATPRQAAGQQQSKPAKSAQIDGTVLRLSADELVQLAPRLRGYPATPAPTWPDVVEAADWLRGELGVSKPLSGEACLAMGEACLAMGREEAAIAVVIVAAKLTGHLRTSPGGYFYGWWPKRRPGS
jgi:replication initiation protein RepC